MGNYWDSSEELSKMSGNVSLKISQSKIIMTMNKA